jgi:hypothetical protein
MAGKEVSLVVGELVWGKVDPHPWWPGKVRSLPFRLHQFYVKTLPKSLKFPSLQTQLSTNLSIQFLPSLKPYSTFFILLSRIAYLTFASLLSKSIRARSKVLGKKELAKAAQIVYSRDK